MDTDRTALDVRIFGYRRGRGVEGPEELMKLNLEFWKTVVVEENKGDGHSRREAGTPNI